MKSISLLRGGSVRAYSIQTPYDAQDIHDLKLDQFRDDITITHRAYRARVLRRSLIGVGESFNLLVNSFLDPRGVSAKTSTEQNRTSVFADNEGGFQWTVGIVDEEGVEQPLNYSDAKLEESVNIGTKLLDLSWDQDANAQAYRIYASSFKPDFGEGPTIPIDEPDTTPVLPSYGGQSGVQDAPFSATLPAASGGDGTITYSIEGGSINGISFNPNKRVFSGTPTLAGTYTITYRATDEDGDYDELTFTVVISDPATPPLAAPGTPTDFEIDSQTIDTITVSFTPPTTGGAPSTYRVVYSANSNITGGDPTITGSGSPITVTNLSPSTTYFIAVRAENEAGNSAYTAVMQVTTSSAAPTRNSTRDIVINNTAEYSDVYANATRIYVQGQFFDDVLVYDAVTRARIASEDFDPSLTSTPDFIVIGAYILFVRISGGTATMLAYSISNGARAASEDIDILDGTPVHVTFGDGKIWVLYVDGQFAVNGERVIRSFTTAGVLDSTIDIPDSVIGHTDIKGLVYADNGLWVVDNADNKALYFRASDGARVPAKDIVLDDTRWNSAASNGSTIWFVDGPNMTLIAAAYDL